jgi:ribose transport system permease protein
VEPRHERLSRRRAAAPLRLSRHRGVVVAIAVFLVAFVLTGLISEGGFSYFAISSLASGGATLALAAMGQTVIILTGGFDLSAGAVISLVNVVLASGMQATPTSEVAFFVVAMAIGGVVGALNGFFVAFMRVQSIVVTLAMMFIVQGVTLLVMNTPGGTIPPGFVNFFTGNAIPNLLPAPVVVLLAALLLWRLVKNSRFGVGLYAVGSDEEAARASGLATRWAKFGAYTFGGIFYGAAGVFISAQTASADPLVGQPLLLQIFAAVVIGGTVFGGGRGGCLGSVFGAYTLMIVVNILLVLNVSAYYSSVVEGVILIFAVLAGRVGHGSPVAFHLRKLRTKWLALRTDRSRRPRAAEWAPPQLPPRAGAAASSALPGWLVRNREAVMFALPGYLGFVLVLIAAQFVFGTVLRGFGYLDSLLVLASFLAILALGQGAAILTGGLDLSIPWMIGFIGIFTSGVVAGANGTALWMIPVGLVMGAALGALNGLGIVLLGLPPIVMTLAMNGILQGIALLFCNGTPSGFAAPAQRWFMTGHLAGVAPVIWFLVGFVVIAVLLLTRTSFGRSIYAVGNSPQVARLSAVGVGRTLVGVYALSGFCSGLVGILLSGFSGQAEPRHGR